MAIKVYPYRAGSQSASAIASGLGGRVLRREGSQYRYRDRDTIINWGSSQCPFPCLNSPDAIQRASNKLTAFNYITRWSGTDLYVPVPDYWTEARLIPDNAFPVVCRTVLTGHSGAGIVIANTRADLVRAPLYVKYQRKTDEYRVHVGVERDGSASVIRVQRKARRRDVPDDQVNWQVRNLDGGFIYQIEGVNPPQEVLDAATNAVRVLGLDFGAADVIYHQPTNTVRLLEVNTACGVTGSTLDDYVSFFNRRIER